MKAKILLSTILITLTASLFAQVDVYFRLNHYLGSTKFNTSHVASNNLGNNFTVERLDYYISEITLIHDGGQRTPVTGHYILVKANEQTNELLGSFNITSLEGVEFGVGVDPSVNHSDITTYPSNHPLSFQSPSMHWGWSAGYRFVAIEGKSGTGMNQTWELHALGDSNYGYATVSTSGTMDGTNLIVALDGDYEKAMNGIVVNGSLNYHGESGKAITIMNNFRNLVFSEGSANIGMHELLAQKINIAPNPSTGLVSISLEGYTNNNLKLKIYSLSGKLMYEQALDYTQSLSFEIDQKGIYLVQLSSNSEVLNSSKLVIQ